MKPSPKRLAALAAGYTVLGAVCSLGFVVVRSAFEGMFNWPMPTTVGYGAPGGDPSAPIWSWQACSDLGVRVCRSDVVDPAAPRITVGPLGPEGWEEGPPPWWSMAAERPSPPPDWAPGHMVFDSAYGLPFACASHRVLAVMHAVTPEEATMYNYRPGVKLMQETLLFGVRRYPGGLARIGVTGGFWPTHILWRGLAGDAAVLGLLLAVPHVCLVRWRARRANARRRRGKCPWCAYSRRGLEPSVPCPECGGEP